ncbi:maltose alpha-D-glucosyltransferase [Rhizobiales bacterium L72]|uniref:Maltokinase n=2 Tax=Propylenella binzhouense TaxID=2555902 RepID=A0A964T4B5_9HYPH|nr:maltose alpha-D-glucosyltransferase [Propylenella binzhouense]MYZ47950.1 maltose alpha-D-glucosyltransferase [Propylenella binzhouense]
MKTISVAPGPDEGEEQHGGITRNDPYWYKDAIIYQLHIKAFFDGNNDGMGDFDGLFQKLDYVESLGVNTIWLLPFYPSPLRDDGYDIADYRSINPAYGDMRDFRRFVTAAHKRGIRVITELVINHTSDQHPWFQRARLARRGSAVRNYYVWSDTDDRYQGTRIIFLDTETSNWTWDPVAQQFFWHRFYSHQPDLNFDNPRVLAEVLRVMRFWLDMGVDGLRLDAIPYLVERDGTNNENLPETHEVLKRIRAELDSKYPDRMLLAEANQWPEDTRPYFGEGDECHMAFHFPLMPRMYMALAQEDRHPITDIIRQTPDIPDPCQWAIFLRNHDELTLEMVTEEERDYLWRTYARDARARINLGIRRRLAPLLENDRRKIELMNALLMSMPGTPIIYYGDELGMGDNYYLGDRDGVRTPMQWSSDRNGGFSRANPQQLYLPPIMDPVYGFEAVNVEAQQNESSSLLNWMRRLIGVRKQRKAFGRGSFTFLYPRNRKVLAYIREHEDERILCVANLARSAQAVELDLSPWRGAVPIELTGRAAFPPVGDLPYMLTLPAYGFFWFVLADQEAAPQWHAAPPDPLPEFVTLTAPGGSLERALDGRDLRNLERDALPEYLARQRWFAGKSQKIQSVALRSLGDLAPGYRLGIADVTTGDGAGQCYFLPLGVSWGEANLRFGAPKLSYTLAKIRSGPKVGALVDAAGDEDFARSVVAAMKAGTDAAAPGGRLRYEATDRLREIENVESVRPVAVEQSNVSIILGEEIMLKVYRRLRPGEQPELEMARFLTERAGYPNTPAYLGAAEYVPDDGEPVAFASAFGFVLNQGDAWSVIIDALDRELDDLALGAELAPAGEAPAAIFSFPLDLASLLGRRTGELHAALSTGAGDPAFAPEPVTAADIGRWAEEAALEARETIAALERARSVLPDAVLASVDRLLEGRQDVLDRLTALRAVAPSGAKIRIHGDYHLGQVLVAQADVMIIDFEGEPQRSLAERRAKASPLRDVAGMLRSFDYAAWAALDRFRLRRGDPGEAVTARAFAWRDRSVEEFLAAYWATVEGVASVPQDAATRDGLLALFLLQKGFYEIGYEAGNRPAWLTIPVRGVLDILETKVA